MAVLPPAARDGISIGENAHVHSDLPTQLASDAICNQEGELLCENALTSQWKR